VQNVKTSRGRRTGPNRPGKGPGQSARSDRPRPFLCRFAPPLSSVLSRWNPNRVGKRRSLNNVAKEMASSGSATRTPSDPGPALRHHQLTRACAIYTSTLMRMPMLTMANHRSSSAHRRTWQSQPCFCVAAPRQPLPRREGYGSSSRLSSRRQPRNRRKALRPASGRRAMWGRISPCTVQTITIMTSQPRRGGWRGNDQATPPAQSQHLRHPRGSPVHELITRLVQEGPKKNLIPNMASGIHRLRPISSRIPMLVEHRPSHLTKRMIFPLNYTIPRCHIGRRELMFETQITTKGFETRVFKLSAIVATNSLNSISIPLILQPQD
jgi:hypothetical protein